MLTETNAYGEDGYFNPEFTEVDRILDVRIVCSDASRPLQREDPELQSLLPERVELCYAIKANPFLVREAENAVSRLRF